jgi:hypothetical protein
MILYHLQKTVFGGQPSKPDHKDVPCAVFRCHESSETCLICLKLVIIINKFGSYKKEIVIRRFVSCHPWRLCSFPNEFTPWGFYQSDLFH